jgi:hypothetical protein
MHLKNVPHTAPRLVIPTPIPCALSLAVCGSGLAFNHSTSAFRGLSHGRFIRSIPVLYPYYTRIIPVLYPYYTRIDYEVSTGQTPVNYLESSDEPAQMGTWVI